MLRHKNTAYKETEELRRLLQIFKKITITQVAEYFGFDVEKAGRLVAELAKRDKRYFDPILGVIALRETLSDFTSKPFWVYLDVYKNGFAKQVYVSSIPFVSCTFVGKAVDRDEIYQLLFVPHGEEDFASYILNERRDDGVFPMNKIVILDEREQRKRLFLNDRYLYCTVDKEGVVSYYD